MRRLGAVLLGLVLLASGCAAGPGTAEPAKPRKKPNFIFVLADDLDDTLMPYMPKTARDITAQGVTLNRYYVNLSWCCPSRASTLRGQYAHNTGVWSNNPPNGGFVEFYKRGEEKDTLATWLAKAGYRSGLFGKYLNGYPEQVPSLPLTRVPPGWDTWVAPVAGHPFQGFDYTLNVNGSLVHRRPSPKTYLTDVLSQYARQFVTAADKRPFFAYIAPVTPHPPAVPAPRHAKLYPGLKAPRTPAYDAPPAGKPTEVRRLPPLTSGEERRWDTLFRHRAQSMRAIDDMVDALVTALRSAGRLDDTYIVVTSDNGFHIGDYRMPPGKNTGYEGDIRVPFVVRGPGVPAGRTVSALAGNTDIAPTLLDLAGARRPPIVDGRSLRPLLSGRRPSGWRSAFLLEHGTARGTHPSARYDLPGKPPDSYTSKTRTQFYLPVFTGLRTDRYLYLDYATGERELYDMERDPYQLHNLAAADPAEVERLTTWIGRLSDCAAASCRTAEARPPER
ncbi:sulfatase-like hydrolase/transferase [Actinomadura rayongensis]|uniref:Sulfatase-like hydrolase/transferase n=1 Tax=Actinomadura rayongensis TaxID=1429076 RepID=A0A6I4WM33_9ACTN|nr:sulfatase-like hydrolase/transferase [Actinomadura rayongensis]